MRGHARYPLLCAARPPHPYRYRHDKWKAKRCRFELTDPAICSRSRSYGPTDLGAKGIESFFANHTCNKYCHHFGGRWQRPSKAATWFPRSNGTSMLSSRVSLQLRLNDPTVFTSRMMMAVEESEEEEESSCDDSNW